MRDHIPDALITAFERQYDSSWNDPQLRNERMAMRYGWAAAMEAKPCLHQIQEPAPATAMDALREAEAALEVAMARILKADPGHSICVTSEAKALVAVRAALAATPAADAPLPLLVRDIARELGITCVEACLALKPLGNFSTNTAVTAGMMAKLRECFPERVPASEVAGARERMTAGRACYFMERFLKEEKLLGPNEQAALHYVIDMLEAAAAPVVLPEPDGFLESHPFGSIYHRGKPNQIQMICGACPPMYEAGTVRALLATGGQAQAVQPITGPCGQCKSSIQPCDCEISTILKDRGLVAVDATHYSKVSAQAKAAAPQAQAVGRGEVLVTVSGFTGSGKSAIAGEIEILCRALGLQVEWPDGESEKNMTHADWTAALEQYKPRVRIVEQNIPFVSKKGLSK